MCEYALQSVCVAVLLCSRSWSIRSHIQSVRGCASVLQVQVDRPDVQGRVEILKVHSKGKILGPDVDLEKVARRTPGFTGVL